MNYIVKLFIGLVVVIAIICSIFLYYNYYVSISLWHFILFTFFIFFTTNFINTSSLSRDINIGMVLPITFIIMDVYGPFWAAIIISISVIKIKHRKEHYIYKFIFNRAMFIITGAASALTYHYLISNPNIDGVFVCTQCLCMESVALAGEK